MPLIYQIAFASELLIGIALLLSAGMGMYRLKPPARKQFRALGPILVMLFGGIMHLVEASILGCYLFHPDLAGSTQVKMLAEGAAPLLDASTTFRLFIGIGILLNCAPFERPGSLLGIQDSDRSMLDKTHVQESSTPIGTGKAESVGTSSPMQIRTSEACKETDSTQLNAHSNESIVRIDTDKVPPTRAFTNRRLEQQLECRVALAPGTASASTESDRPSISVPNAFTHLSRCSSLDEASPVSDIDIVTTSHTNAWNTPQAAFHPQQQSQLALHTLKQETRKWTSHNIATQRNATNVSLIVPVPAVRISSLLAPPGPPSIRRRMLDDLRAKRGDEWKIDEGIETNSSPNGGHFLRGFSFAEQECSPLPTAVNLLDPPLAAHEHPCTPSTEEESMQQQDHTKSQSNHSVTHEVNGSVLRSVQSSVSASVEGIDDDPASAASRATLAHILPDAFIRETPAVIGEESIFPTYVRQTAKVRSVHSPLPSSPLAIGGSSAGLQASTFTSSTSSVGLQIFEKLIRSNTFQGIKISSVHIADDQEESIADP